MDRLSGGEGKGLLWEKKTIKLVFFIYLYLFMYFLRPAEGTVSGYICTNGTVIKL